MPLELNPLNYGVGSIDDLASLVGTLQGEAGNQPMKGRALIVDVGLNRALDPSYAAYNRYVARDEIGGPQTYTGIAAQLATPSQFSTWIPSQASYGTAVEYNNLIHSIARDPSYWDLLPKATQQQVAANLGAIQGVLSTGDFAGVSGGAVNYSTGGAGMSRARIDEHNDLGMAQGFRYGGHTFYGGGPENSAQIAQRANGFDWDGAFAQYEPKSGIGVLPKEVITGENLKDPQDLGPPAFEGMRTPPVEAGDQLFDPRMYGDKPPGDLAFGGLQTTPQADNGQLVPIAGMDLHGLNGPDLSLFGNDNREFGGKAAGPPPNLFDGGLDGAGKGTGDNLGLPAPDAAAPLAPFPWSVPPGTPGADNAPLPFSMDGAGKGTLGIDALGPQAFDQPGYQPPAQVNLPPPDLPGALSGLTPPDYGFATDGAGKAGLPPPPPPLAPPDGVGNGANQGPFELSQPGAPGPFDFAGGFNPAEPYKTGYEGVVGSNNFGQNITPEPGPQLGMSPNDVAGLVPQIAPPPPELPGALAGLPQASPPAPAPGPNDFSQANLGGGPNGQLGSDVTPFRLPPISDTSFTGTNAGSFEGPGNLGQGITPQMPPAELPSPVPGFKYALVPTGSGLSDDPSLAAQDAQRGFDPPTNERITKPFLPPLSDLLPNMSMPAGVGGVDDPMGSGVPIVMPPQLPQTASLGNPMGEPDYGFQAGQVGDPGLPPPALPGALYGLDAPPAQTVRQIPMPQAQPQGGDGYLTAPPGDYSFGQSYDVSGGVPNGYLTAGVTPQAQGGVFPDTMGLPPVRPPDMAGMQDADFMGGLPQFAGGNTFSQGQAGPLTGYQTTQDPSYPADNLGFTPNQGFGGQQAFNTQMPSPIDNLGNMDFFAGQVPNATNAGTITVQPFNESEFAQGGGGGGIAGGYADAGVNGIGGAAPMGTLGGGDFSQAQYMALVAQNNAQLQNAGAQDYALAAQVNPFIVAPGGYETYLPVPNYVAPPQAYRPNIPVAIGIGGGGGGIGGGGQPYF